MRTLRSPHNVELKTPQAKFCLDFDLVGAPVYIHVLCTNKHARLCARGKRVSTLPENHDGASTVKISYDDTYLRRRLRRFARAQLSSLRRLPSACRLVQSLAWKLIRENSQIGRTSEQLANRSNELLGDPKYNRPSN